MKRFFLAGSVVVVGMGLFSSNVSAQSSVPCGCGSTDAVAVASSTGAGNPAYQRFSYEPTASVLSQGMYTQPAYTQPTSNAIVAQLNVVRSTPVVLSNPSVQSYRRFSYEPSATARSNGSGRRMETWEYSKADPRKYR